MRGYVNADGKFMQILYGDKAFELVDGEMVEYEVKEYNDFPLPRRDIMYSPPLYSEKEYKALEQENKALKEKVEKLKNLVQLAIEFKQNLRVVKTGSLPDGFITGERLEDFQETLKNRLKEIKN